MRIWLIALALAGCKKAPATPEDKLLWQLGGKLAEGDRAGVAALYDLDGRQRTELWEKTVRKLAKPDDQAAALAAAKPRLGEAEALRTVGEEAYRELDAVVAGPLAAELADGRCAGSPPNKEDVDRWVLPKEKQGMPQELGLFAFETRTAFDWTPALRVRCPGGDFWAQLARRKKPDAPLLMLRVEK